MVIVYHKGILYDTFASLIDAEKFVHQCLEEDWSAKEEDFAYSFY